MDPIVIMNPIVITTVEIDGKIVFLKPDADLGGYKPEHIRRRQFDARPRSHADTFLAVDVSYEILDATGIVPGPAGYAPGAWTAVQRTAAAVVRCTKVTDGEKVAEPPTAADMLSLPPEVLERYVAELDGAAALTRTEWEQVKNSRPSGSSG